MPAENVRSTAPARLAAVWYLVNDVPRPTANVTLVTPSTTAARVSALRDGRANGQPSPRLTDRGSKHGDGQKAQVTVRYADHALRVEVLNTGPSVLSGGRSPGPDGEGRGLLGLRQRVAVYGGDLDARRRLGGGYRVRAKIPL